MIKGGGMKLYELHVGDVAPGTPRHRNAVPRGDLGIGRVQIDLATAPGGKQGRTSRNGRYLSMRLIQHQGAVTLAVGNDKINCGIMLENQDIWMLPHGFDKSSLDLAPG
jgi:hypothetical protein